MAKEKDNKVKNENKHFMRDVKAELKRVVWPTSKQMVNNVTAVITIVIVTAAIVFLLDFVFESANRYGINKIKQNVQQKNNQEQTQVVNDSSNQINDGNDSNNSVVEETTSNQTVDGTTEGNEVSNN